MNRMNVDSLVPPGLSGCARGCGRFALAVDIEATEDGGGDKMESGRKPPALDEAGEKDILWYRYSFNLVDGRFPVASRYTIMDPTRSMRGS